MSAMASQITSVSLVCSTVCSGADRGKHQSSASQDFVRGIHRWPLNSPHKGIVTWKMFPFDDVSVRQIRLSTHYYNYPLAATCIPTESASASFAPFPLKMADTVGVINGENCKWICCISCHISLIFIPMTCLHFLYKNGHLGHWRFPGGQ